MLTKWRSDSSLPTLNSRKGRSLLDVILGRHKQKASTTKAMDPFDRYLQSQKSQAREQIPERPHTWPRSSAEDSRSRQLYIQRLKSADPKATWKTVNRDVASLRNSGVKYRMKDTLKRKVLIEIHTKGHLELLERDVCREYNAKCRQEVYHYRTTYPRGGVIHETLHKVLMVASTPVIMRGSTHDIPIIVHACVSEIVQRGLFDPSIFNETANEKKVLHIANIFDCGPFFGDGFKVDKSKISTLSAVLVHFLNHLDGPPVIHPMIFDAIKKWSVSLSGKKHEEIACTIASNLLKFLPVANLSLLTYMLDFFLRILNCPQNDFRPGEVASVFGRYLIGRRMNGEDYAAVVWLMGRWPSIVRELYGDGSGNDAWGVGKAASVSVQRVTNNPSMSAHQIRWHAEQRQHTQAVAHRDQIARRAQQLPPQPPPRHVPMPESREEIVHLDVPVEHSSTMTSTRRRAASFASTASAYSNNDEEEFADHPSRKDVILRRLQAHAETVHLQVPGTKPTRPPILRLPTGISATDEIVVMPSTSEASSAVNLSDALKRAPTTRFRPHDDLMSVPDYYASSDSEPGQNKKHQLGMLDAKNFAAERQVSILIRSQAHMVAQRRKRAGEQKRYGQRITVTESSGCSSDSLR